MFGLLPLLGIAAGAAAVVAVASESSSTSYPQWNGIRLVPDLFGSGGKLKRVPPAYPFVAPNAGSPYPLVWWAQNDTRPNFAAIAMDVRGVPFAGHQCSPGDGWNRGVDKPWGGQFVCSVENKDYVNGDTFYAWTETSWDTSGPSVADTINTIVTKYVVPIAITIAGAAIGGAGGAVAAFALSAVWNVATGSRIDRAVIAAYQDRLENVVNRSALGDAYRTVVSTPIAGEQIVKLRDAAAQRVSEFEREGVVKAFDVGAGLANVEKLQRASVAALKLHISAEEGAWLDTCLARGAALVDWVTAMYGRAGTDVLQAIMHEMTARIEAGQDVPQDA